jgi:histidine triad (HIT) family protein
MALKKEQAEQIKKQLLEQIKKLPKDQQEGLKEQIEDANPEELEEFIKQQQQASGQGKCIFCEITAKRMDSVRVYEDQDILAVMEIMPATKGHLLVMPKQHFQFIQEIPSKLLEKIFYFVKTLNPILIKILDAKALSIYIPQGQLAGQRIQHFVINLIPRYEADNLAFDWEHKKADTKELEALAEKIRKASQSEVVKGIKEEQEKYEKKRKQEIETEAQKIMKQKGKRMP